MLHVLRLQWHAVGRMVELEEDRIPDICTVNPALFGQGHLPRSDAESCEIARFIADAPLMYQLLEYCIETGRADRQIIELVDRHK